jgi:hypothetical protein
MRRIIAPKSRRAKMALGQQEPIIPRTLHQPACRLHQPLLQALPRPVVHALRQHSRLDKVGITLSHGRSWFDRNRWQLSRVIFSACWPSLIVAAAISAVPRSL